jgi:peptide/nickel transport system substrate-binding protein
MLTRYRGAAGLAGLAAAAMVLTACGGSSSPGPGDKDNGNKPQSSAFHQEDPNNDGEPVQGGTLNVLSSGDTDYLDPNVTYYSFGYAIVRPWSRGLYNYPAEEGHQTDAVPDIATVAPEVSSDGLTYTVHLREGVKWNTNPARQVTAEDAVRGIKAACNPVQPFGGLPNFSDLIEGYQDFCDGYGKATTASAISKYAEGNDISGVQADPSDPLTLTFKLTKPASYFASMLALPTFSPRPKEMNDYVPGSPQAAQHTVADGPYQVESYQPTKKLVLTRNPAWDGATDPVRKAYVDKIIVDMTVSDRAIGFKQQQAGSEGADVCELCVQPSEAIQMINNRTPGLVVGSSIASNPYVLFNTQSPNNDGALGKVEVRQALSFAIDRAKLLQVGGGPKLSPALTHVLPPAINGSEEFDLYPHDAAKAKQMLTDAGVSGLKLKFLYRPTSETSTKMFQILQQDLGDAGIKLTGVEAQDADFYTKYLQNPDSAKRGEWDLSLAGWGPDWYGDAALSFFGPLFDGRILPPVSSDFGLFNDPKVNDCIDAAKSETDNDAANAKWTECDHAVMEAAAFYPITSPNEAIYHPPFVHNTIYMPVTQGFDWANLWLDENKQGG